MGKHDVIHKTGSTYYILHITVRIGMSSEKNRDTTTGNMFIKFRDVWTCGFWATGCKTVRPMLSVRCPVCPVCLSVTFVHCGQTVGRIKIQLRTQVGLGPGHIVLDGDTAPPTPKGHSPAIIGPYLLRPNGCMDQAVTWYGARPRPRRLCVRW